MQSIDTLILLGKPGAGKGTQSGILKQQLRMEPIPYGEFFRNIASQESFLSHKVKNIIDDGYLLPYWIPSYVLIDYMIHHSSQKQGMILDGAARVKEEAIIIHKVLTWFERSYKVVYIDIDDEVVIERLTIRKNLLDRVDDEEAHIRNRLKEYHNSISPVLEYFESKDALITVNGNQSMEAVSKDILKSLL